MALRLYSDVDVQNIADAIREKNGSSDTYKVSEMATAINNISSDGITPTGTLDIIENGTYDVTTYANANVNIEGGGSEEWIPDPEWWDIDDILENDTENASSKIIVLLNDAFNTSQTLIIPKCYKVYYSDGTTYQNTATGNITISHEWDIEYDKECSLGYKTRYFIMYFNDNNITFWNINMFAANYNRMPLYIIVKDMTALQDARYFGGLTNLKALKFINTINTNSTFNLDGCNNIEVVKGYVNNNLTSTYFKNCYKFDRKNINYSKINNLQLFYSGYSEDNIIFPETMNLSNITNYSNLLDSNCNLTINKIDFTSATSFTGTATNLISINEILGNIKFNLNISTWSALNHDTLLRFLNALYDYSTEGGTHTASFGTTNLAKLTDTEKAIATTKGWTLS